MSTSSDYDYWRSGNWTRVVAEYGQTMGGSLDEAHDQVTVAAEAGCWGYKTQLLTPDTIAQADAPLYWANTLGHTDQRSAFAGAGLIPYSAWGEIADHCTKEGIRFVASPFDLAAVDVLSEMRAVIKVASGDITYRQLLERVAATGCPTILSTGASTIGEVTQAVEILSTGGPLVVLACTLAYPTPENHAHLARIETLRREFPDFAVGYSDHTSSPATALACGAMGAAMVEVHTTLRPTDQDVADHAMALDPTNLARYVREVDHGTALRGSPLFGDIYGPEHPARVGARRSLCAARCLNVGDVITEDDLIALRPGDGVSPWWYQALVGATVLAPIDKGEPLRIHTNVTVNRNPPPARPDRPHGAPPTP